MKHAHWLAITTVTAALAVAAVAWANSSFAPPPAAVTGPATDNAARHAALTRTGESRFDWNWLARKCDADGDGIVSSDEFPGSQTAYERLDRTWDGSLTADDFDWSADGDLCRQKETTFALFKSADVDSNGRISSEEWQKAFADAAAEADSLNEEELERLIYLPRVRKTKNEVKNFASITAFLQHANSQFSPNLPQVGDLAPDFELQSADGLSRVRLSLYRGKKPVVLIFGCFSCGNYRTYSASLEKMYERWKEDCEFLRVYVREAHPAKDGRATATNARAGILVPQPSTFDDRCQIAGQCAAALEIGGPILIDELDDRVGRAWGGWPDRLYIVDRDGRVAYCGGPGPFGFNPAEMEQSLSLLLMSEESE